MKVEYRFSKPIERDKLMEVLNSIMMLVDDKFETSFDYYSPRMIEKLIIKDEFE